MLDWFDLIATTLIGEPSTWFPTVNHKGRPLLPKLKHCALASLMVPSQSDHCFIDRGHPPFPVWPEYWLTTIPPIEGLEDELTHIDKGIVISLSRTSPDTHWEKLYALFVHYANTSESFGLALQSPFLPQSLPVRTVRYASISFDNLHPKSPSDHVQHWDQPTEHHCSPCLKLYNGGEGCLISTTIHSLPVANLEAEISAYLDPVAFNIIAYSVIPGYLSHSTGWFHTT